MRGRTSWTITRTRKSQRRRSQGSGPTSGLPHRVHLSPGSGITLWGPSPIRSAEFPYGIPKAAQETKELLRTHNLLRIRTAELCELIWKQGGEFGIEQPAHIDKTDPSLFQFSEMKGLVKRTGATFTAFDQCRYGGESTKPTWVLGARTNSAPLHSGSTTGSKPSGESKARPIGHHTLGSTESGHGPRLGADNASLQSLQPIPRISMQRSRERLAGRRSLRVHPSISERSQAVSRPALAMRHTAGGSPRNESFCGL